MKYSLIIPVYNRPDEVAELLESLTVQRMKDFEVIIVEDGSQTPCKEVCDRYADRLDLHYHVKENGGRDRHATMVRSAPKANTSLCSTATWWFLKAISRR